MAASGSEMEALVVVKWRNLQWGKKENEKEERESNESNGEEEEAGSHFNELFIFTNRFSVDNNLMKRIVVLIDHYRRKICR